MVQRQQGRWDEAAGTLEEALALVRPMPYPYARILHEYGMLHVHEGEPERARERFHAALDIFRGRGAREDAGRTERALGPT